ncbi:cyclin-D1-binding protein 1 homolog isoform X2 [Oscarella lobularis]|uniref:cyclin-D1-binding protein 1 homolog isoform X2 n=1 Tax=Oscarella lobularis TaxID=121494 RepID=UPI0033139A18
MSEKNLRSFVEKLVLVEKEITSSSRRRCDDAFVLSEFWRDFKAAASLLSREATKLSLAFGKPPLPRDEECKRLVADIDAAVSVIISCFHRLPSDQGRTLLEVVTVAVQKIVTRVRLLFVSLEKGEKFTSTGLVWDACDLLEDLPRDNKQAVLRHLETIAGLVKDALSELEEAQTSQGVLSDFDMDMDDDAQVTEWTEEEKKLVAPCSGLVKGCRSLLKKLRASLIKKSAQENGDLDSLVDILRCLNERYIRVCLESMLLLMFLQQPRMLVSWPA